MKNSYQIFITILLSLCVISGKAESHIKNFASCNMLEVNGKPMVILGGELGNSSASSTYDIHENLKKITKGHLNTVLVPAYWDLLEPQEGNFDFSLIDDVIDTAKKYNLKVVFLWFGAWKNSMSCYTPEWVKRDSHRFPRARTESGKPLEILSAFSEEVAQSDIKAFKSLLEHIKEYDKEGNVIMIQVENEIGMLESARDYSDLANTKYHNGVPPELMNYLEKNKNNLDPTLLKKWGENGFKMKGGWKDVFGDDIFTDEYFMAWNYANYVERLASKGKETLPVVFYLNAAMNSRGRLPGEYPSAGPLAHLKDFWHAGAPSIDFLSPDIYDSGFENWVSKYALPDNILFVPEVKRDSNNGAQAYYIIGHHGALGISPFSIENGNDEYFSSLAKSYDIISELSPILSHPDKWIWMDGVLLSSDSPEQQLCNEEEYSKITLSHFFTLPWDPRATDLKNWNDQGAIIMKIAPEEYILAGSGIVAKFEHKAERSLGQQLGEDGFATVGNSSSPISKGGDTPRIGLAKVEEIKINPDGSFQTVRIFNGDETHQGRHVRIGVDDHKILHIKTYKFE